MYVMGSGGSNLDCPKCKFSMEPLRSSAILDTREGYVLDNRVGCDVDDNVVTSYLFGSLVRFLWRYFLMPISSKLFGDWKSRRYRKILGEYPHSLICTHCQHVVKRR